MVVMFLILPPALGKEKDWVMFLGANIPPALLFPLGIFLYLVSEKKRLSNKNAAV